MARGEGLGVTGGVQIHTGHLGEPPFPYNGHLEMKNL